MKNIWKKNNQYGYDFFVNGTKQGQFLDSHTNKSSTAIAMDNEEYRIVRKGFWKNRILILNQNGTEILSLTPEKWFSSSFLISYNGLNYTLKIGNNPLSEWSIYKDSELQLAYSLSVEEGKPGLKIDEPVNAPLLFHYLLWYLIEPTILEQNGQNGDFMLLTMAGISN